MGALGALGLLQEPAMDCFLGAAICVCEQGKQWEEALELLQDFQFQLVELDMCIFNVAMAAFAQ